MFSKKPKTIYIHIGFMKTGTSAIQSYLKSNRESLIEKGLLYPKINIKAMNYLGFSLLEEVPPYVHHTLPLKRNELYLELNNEIQNSSCDNIVISSESFSLLTTHYFLGEKAPLLLKELLNKPNYRFKIIVNVRRQEDYLLSQYNQHVKTHDFWGLYSGTIEDFYRDKYELFDFNTVIEKWEKVFGFENMIVGIYDKSMDSVSKFMKHFDLKGLTFSNNKNLMNTSLSPKSLEFMRLANKFGILKRTAEQNYRLVELLERVLRSKATKEMDLDPVLSQKIQREMFKSNHELSKKYLKGDLEWFSGEKGVSNFEETDRDLTSEDLIKISVEIWNHFQKCDDNE